MIAQRTTLTAADLPDSLLALRTDIGRRIPHGHTNNGGPGDRGAWHDIPASNLGPFGGKMGERLSAVFEKQPKLKSQWTFDRAASHLGTRRWFINLPDADLAYLPQGSDLFKDYCDAVQWA